MERLEANATVLSIIIVLWSD